MKKKLLFSGVLVVAVAAISVTYALSDHASTPEIQNVAIKTASITPKAHAEQTEQPSEDTTPTREPAKQITTTTGAPSTQVPVSTTTPEENKAKIMKVITDYATSHLNAKSANQLASQTNSFDNYFLINFGGYSDYDTLYNSDVVQQYLAGKEMWVSFLHLGPQSDLGSYL